MLEEDVETQRLYYEPLFQKKETQTQKWIARFVFGTVGFVFGAGFGCFIYILATKM